MLRCRMALESRRDWWKGREMRVGSVLGPRKGTCARTGWQLLMGVNGDSRPNTVAHVGLGNANPQLLTQCEPVIQIWPRTPTCLVPWIPWAHLTLIIYSSTSKML